MKTVTRVDLSKRPPVHVSALFQNNRNKQMIKINIVFSLQELQKLLHLPSKVPRDTVHRLRTSHSVVQLSHRTWQAETSSLQRRSRSSCGCFLWRKMRVNAATLRGQQGPTCSCCRRQLYFVPAHYLPPEADVFLYIPHINSNFNNPRPRLHAHLFASEMISVSVCRMKALKVLLYTEEITGCTEDNPLSVPELFIKMLSLRKLIQLGLYAYSSSSTFSFNHILWSIFRWSSLLVLVIKRRRSLTTNSRNSFYNLNQHPLPKVRVCFINIFIFFTLLF